MKSIRRTEKDGGSTILRPVTHSHIWRGGGGGGGEVRPCNSNIAYPRFINFFCAFL